MKKKNHYQNNKEISYYKYKVIYKLKSFYYTKLIPCLTSYIKRNTMIIGTI